MRTWCKKICTAAGLLVCAVFASRSSSLAVGGTLGVFSGETLARTPLGITLAEAEQLYGKKHFPTSWASKGQIWNFPEYSLILFFDGPGNVSSRLTVCKTKSLTLAEAAQYASKHLPKGYSVVRSKLSNDSQPVVFKSSNPLNGSSTGGWTSRSGWYCLDFHNARPKEEMEAKDLLDAIQEGVSEKTGKRTQEQMAELRAKPRLGMTLEELKALWGEGWPRDLKKYPCTLEGRNSRNDKDYLVFASIVPQCTAWQWMFRERQNLSITAILWRGRCVGLDLNRTGGFTVAEAIELASEIVPGIAFPLPSTKKDGVCTLYSRNLEQGYKLQHWGDKGYFELKSSLLIKRMKAQRPMDQKNRARVLGAAMKKFSDKTQKPLMGLTLDDVREVLGGKGQELAEHRWNERTWLWSDPNQDLILLGSFRDGGKHMFLHHLVVMDREHELDLHAALAIGYAATQPYTWPALSSAQLKSGFSIKSRDGQQRFLLKWYRDTYTGPTLHLVDGLVDRVARKQAAEKPKKTLETIKNIL